MSSDVKTIYQDEDEEIKALLLGRRVVRAEEGDFQRPESSYYRASGRLTLDDGTQILVTPNEGGCSCGAGDYSLTSLASVDNVITAVRVSSETEDTSYGEGPTKYQIFVFADAAEVNLLTIDGDDGNGYYGTGYALTVIPGVSA